MPKDSLAECRARIEFFKNCIENHDGYKLITEDTDERALQLMFWLVWYGSAMDINRECANGKGTCDYAISCGSNDKCVIEIKLGSNSSLSSGLKCQLDVYKKVNGTPKGIYLVVCKTEKEISHCRTIAEHCNLIEGDNIYIIDATNKVTASKLKMNHDGL